MSTSAIDELKRSLAQINAKLTISNFANVSDMKRTADEFERKFGLGRAPDEQLIVRIVQKFFETGSLSGYREVKAACYGLLLPISGTKSIARDQRSLVLFLNVVEKYGPEPKKLKRCFQAVMNAYFSLDGFGANSAEHMQWALLGQHLQSWLPMLASLSPMPDWLSAAYQYQHLFGSDPTAGFGASVLQEGGEDFTRACERLIIPQDSWVRRQAIISAIMFAAKHNDRKFGSLLTQTVELLDANPLVRREGLALLLDRYSKSDDRPEHELLRTRALEVFGNPLINAHRPRWSIVSEAARDMVSDWLKEHLIERFFELLSADGRSDRRRPKYWQKYRGTIQNMWFVLGPSAMDSRNEDYKKLRSTMGNQCLALDGSGAGNNAFIMKLGGIYAVEFGEKGNAAFLFDQTSLPFDLSSRHLHRARLGGSRHLERLLHMDGRIKWEQKFDEALASHKIFPDEAVSYRAAPIARTPRTPPPAWQQGFLREVKRQCSEWGVLFEDHRTQTGRCFVHTGASNKAIAGQLAHWGFEYEPEHHLWTKKA